MRFNFKNEVFTVGKLLSLFKAGNLILNPGFQRDSVWEESDRALLIDSILHNVPLPSILLWHEKRGHKNIYYVVDGKQRIETLIKFSKPQLPFKYSSIKVIKQHGDKRWADVYEEFHSDEISFKSLSRPQLKHFKSFEIPAVVIQGASEVEDIRELFVRVNSTGMKLQPSEIRHARFLNSDLLREAERIASLKSIQTILINNKIFTKAQFKRMKVVEFVTELMLSMKTGDVLDKKSSIDAMMESNLTKLQVKKLGQEAKSIIEHIAKFISDSDNRLKTTRFRNTADLYALSFCLWKMKKSGMIIGDKARSNLAFSILVDLDIQLKRYGQAFKEGKRSKALPDIALSYQKTISSNTDSRANRSSRVEIIKSLIEPAFVKKDADRLFSRELKELLWHSSTDKKCSLCSNQIVKFEDLEIDHRFAHAKGGKTNSANAQIAHRKCNRKKGAR